MSTQPPWPGQPQGQPPGGFGGTPPPGGAGATPPPGGAGAPPPWPPQQGGQPPGGFGGPPGAPGGYAPPPGGPGGSLPPGAPGGYAPPPGYQGQGQTKSKGPLIAGLVALLVLVLGVGGFFAWRFISGSSDDLVANVPADAIVYTHLNLNPSASNKLGIQSLIDRVNAAAGEELLSIDGLLEELEADADGVSFAEDIDPWLGDQVALYALALPVPDPETFDQPAPVFAAVLALDDPDAAAEFVEDQGTEGSWDAGEGRRGWLIEGDAADSDALVIAIDGNRLYLGNPDGVRAGLDPDEPLGADPRYTDAIGALPDRVVTIWVDVPAIAEAVDQAAGQMAMATGQDLPAAVASGISFGDGVVDVVTVVTASGEDPITESERIAPLELADLPAGGIFYARVPDLGAFLPTALATADETAREEAAAFGETIPEDELPSSLADQVLREELGTSVDELAGWMGDLATMVAYDPASAERNAAMILQLAVADEDAAVRLVDRVLDEVPDEIRQEEGIQIGRGSITAGDLSLAAADEAITLSIGRPADGTLGADEAFAAALDGLAGEPLVYLDIRGLTEAIVAFAIPSGTARSEDRRAADIAGAFDSLVVTSEQTGDGGIRATLRLSFRTDLEPVDLDAGEPNPPDIDLGPFGTADELLAGGGLEDMGLPVGGSPEDQLAELRIDLFDAAFVMDSEFFVDGAYVPPDRPFETFVPGSIIEPLIVEPDAYCLAGIIPSGDQLIYDSISQDVSEATDPFSACTEALGAGVAPTDPGPVPGEPFTFGDDPALDALWTACAEGDFASCDGLFDSSPIGSDYELFALTCGDRNDPSGEFCVELYGE